MTDQSLGPPPAIVEPGGAGQQRRHRRSHPEHQPCEYACRVNHSHGMERSESERDHRGSALPERGLDCDERDHHTDPVGAECSPAAPTALPVNPIAQSDERQGEEHLGPQRPADPAESRRHAHPPSHLRSNEMRGWHAARSGLAVQCWRVIRAGRVQTRPSVRSERKDARSTAMCGGQSVVAGVGFEPTTFRL